MADLTFSAHSFLTRRFGHRQPPALLFLFGGLATALVAIPLSYLLVKAVSADQAVWERLAQTRLLGLMFNTISLAATVTAGTVVIGVSLAWLVERTNLWGRRVWRWLLAMPLAIPTYIGAIIHLSLLRPRGGYLVTFLENLAGRPVDTPSPFGFVGVTFILTLYMYPYVYLLSAAAFRKMHAAQEEAARSLGYSLGGTFWRVTLPTLRPGISAGALLVALDILAEYGTVALLRYETFSSAIYLQLAGRYDRSAAAVLSGVLVMLALLILVGEMRLKGKARFYQVNSNWRPAPTILLRAWQVPALLVTLALIFMALIVPMAMLLWWTFQAFNDPGIVASNFQAGSQSLGTFTWNSLWSAGLAAILAVLFSLPVAFLVVRFPNWWTRLFSRLSQVGYALPGVVVALSLVLVVNHYLPFLYATPLLVVLAYVLRHMPQAVRSSEAAMEQLSPVLEEAAQSLGRSSLRAYFEVSLRVILPGLVAGGTLVFLTSLKELPATLLLRPAGFDTLAVRVWMWAGEGMYSQAAPTALVLILAAAGPLYFLLHRKR